MTILVGCSGWSYDDWVGRFDPMGLAKKKGEWLSYYAQFFNTVEINSTYYHPPGERQVQSWIKKVKDREGGFKYSVKMPGLVTHQALVEGDEEKALFRTGTFEKTCLTPLADANLLGAVLFQLSPHFKHEGQALDRLSNVLDSLAQKEYDLVVEFRHRSWLDESSDDLDPATLDVLKEGNIANVLIDGPGHYPGNVLQQPRQSQGGKERISNDGHAPDRAQVKGDPSPGSVYSWGIRKIAESSRKRTSTDYDGLSHS
ncbi:MAG: Uncharacterized protein XD72_1259 [Methanothrix harundinacea]|uniref:DUF72 domain-containing protein n=1 Tax=Methanothrix harundinacea TaxID=301375 RepID=A0A101FTS7_9EURY|nr:MAG: Uncharacterized protein XD72_1259 [Methanothrix harundinacea]